MLQRFLLSTASYRYQLLDNGLRASYDAARNFICPNEPQLLRTSSSATAMRFIKIAKGYGRASDCRHADTLALSAGNSRSRSGRKRRGTQAARSGARGGQVHYHSYVDDTSEPEEANAAAATTSR